MPRYAIANNTSGVVRGVTTAPNPVAACRMFDRSLGERGKVYEEHGPRSRSANATANAYAVYQATEEFRDVPAQPGVTAEAIDGLIKVAVVVVRD